MELQSWQKKVLYVIGLLLIASVFAFFIYILFFKPPKEQYVNVNGQLVPVEIFPTINLNLNKGTQENINGYSGLPQIDAVARGGNTLAETLTETTAQDATRAEDGKSMQYYNAGDGKFYKIDEKGEIVALSSKIFQGVTKTTWSKDSNAAVLELEDGYKIYYDFKKNKQYTLSKEMEDFSFSPTGEQIAYKFMATDPEDRQLGVTNPDGSGVSRITGLGDNADSVQVNWSPSGKAVATWDEFIDGSREKVIPLGLHGENFKQMIVEGKGFEYQWSPTGQQMLYSVNNAESGFKPTLWVVDAEGDQIGENRINLGINTWQEKCSFSSKTEIYCAVPNSLPTGAAKSKSIADNIPDTIYKIDLSSGVKTIVAVPVDSTGSTQYTIDSLFTSTDGNNLFFTDKADKKIHKIKLK